jgi:Zn-dependent protease with chaperone function/type II secretory pathway pseudopilin PulG
MKSWVYPRERALSQITLVIGIILWLALIAGTFGVALILLAVGFLAYLFAQSALIAHLRGNGVALSPAQCPALHEQFVACCERLQIKTRPEAFVLNGNGVLNAFATRFLGTQYVVLMSDIVGAMQSKPDGVRFYIGHELGHLRMKHIQGHLLRWPALWIPLLGAAYSRARESTCDRHGAACCDSPEAAAQALVVLSAGTRLWQEVDLPAFAAQARHSGGFWMSFHELTAGYPWISKRVQRVLAPEAKLPRRHPGAWLMAAFVPFAGRLGGGFGVLMLVYVVGVLAAVALPAYQDYVGKAKLDVTVQAMQPTLAAVGGYYQSHKAVPDTLGAAGVAEKLPDGSALALDTEHMVVTATTPFGPLEFTPRLDAQGRVSWSCSAGEGLRPGFLPRACATPGAGR